jgi:fused signal recognition particle receptor
MSTPILLGILLLFAGAVGGGVAFRAYLHKRKARGEESTQRSVLPEEPSLPWEEIEAELIRADLGVETVEELLKELKKACPKTRKELEGVLLTLLKERVSPFLRTDLEISTPGVILLVGPNGTGKTTTAGKLAYFFKQKGIKVVLGAADTFRAAATAQLMHFARRLEVPFAGDERHRDPKARVYAAIERAHKENALAILDTGGRNPKNEGLLRELKGMFEVGTKAHRKPPEECWLVLDAHQGMIALPLVEGFQKVVPLTGIFVAKWDSIAGGGFLLPLWKQTPVPLVGIGIGEKPEDLLLPTPEAVARRILSQGSLKSGVLG